MKKIIYKTEEIGNVLGFCSTIIKPVEIEIKNPNKKNNK